MNLDVVHPLTGPVYVNGAEPGDLLEVHIVDVEPAEFGFTTQIAGFGFLRDYFDQPYIVHWTIADGYATAPELPRVRIPGASFPGVIGLAPSHELLQKTIAREQALLERGGAVLTPNPADAVPNDPRIAAEALRTIPPRETGGNLDVKQLSKGVRLAIPVSAPGALFSIGDAHFAQGDGECCGTAIEMCATFHLEFQVRKGVASQRNIREVQFARDDYYGPPSDRAAALPRYDRDVDRQRRDQPLRGRHAGGAQRAAQYDRLPWLRARAVASAGVRAGERGGRPEAERAGGRAELRGVGVSATRYLRLAHAALVVLVRGVHGGAAHHLYAARVQDGFQSGEHLQHRFAAGVGAHRADAPHLPAQRTERGHDLDAVLVEQVLAPGSIVDARGNAHQADHRRPMRFVGKQLEPERDQPAP